jgi:hypothetical protein
LHALEAVLDPGEMADHARDQNITLIWASGCGDGDGFHAAI